MLDVVTIVIDNTGITFRQNIHVLSSRVTLTIRMQATGQLTRTRKT